MSSRRLAPWIACVLAVGAAAHRPQAVAAPRAADEAEERWWWPRTGEVPVGVIRELWTRRADGTGRTEEVAELRPWQNGAERVTKWARDVEQGAAGGITWFKNVEATPDRLVTSEGTVADGTCTLVVEVQGQEATTHQIPWPAGVLGPMGIEQLRCRKGFAAGTKYNYLAWDFVSWRIVSFEAEVEVAADRLHGATGDRTAARLVVRQLSPPGASLLEWWADGHCVRRWTAALGDASCVRVPKDLAIGGGTGILAAYSVSELARLRTGAPAMPRPSEVTAATYRLRLDSGEWGGIELGGPEQRCAAATDGSWVVQVTAGRLPSGGPTLPLTVPEAVRGALADSYWMGLDGPVIPAAAKAIVGGEKNAAKAVERIVDAVGDRLRRTPLNAGMATAHEAWRQREGDCLEHAVCVVALCRATGIPARLAGGLRCIGGRFQYHAWAEVWVGDWHGVDAMTPNRRCDAARIRFGTGWLIDNRTPEEALVNVGTVVKRLEVEVVEAAAGGLRLGGDASRIQDRVFEDAAWGVHITVPAGWKMHGPDPSVQATIAVARGERGRRINVRAGTVGLHQGAWELARDARDAGGFEVLNPKEIEVDGVRAVMADLRPLKGSGYAPRTAYVVDGETLFVVEYAGQAADAVAAFTRMLQDWRWLRRRGK